MPNKLYTVFCHKCNKFMNYPYEHKGELYHKECLPFKVFVFEGSLRTGMTIAKCFTEHLNDISASQDRKNRVPIDEACKYLDLEAWSYDVSNNLKE